MSNQKKIIRARFREAVFTRDNHMCVVPGCTNTEDLDAHHITDRNLMPNGGYVKENGATLCPPHHVDAEIYHSTGVAKEGFHPDDLYKMIKSSYATAVAAAKRMRV
jgi:5-methylcytosine-specific restriction endonuclease McrA